jgi:hypothetical protein
MLDGEKTKLEVAKSFRKWVNKRCTNVSVPVDIAAKCLN